MGFTIALGVLWLKFLCTNDNVALVGVILLLHGIALGYCSCLLVFALVVVLVW